MEETKGKGKVIAIVVLIIMVLGLGGYIVYDKFIQKEAEPVVPQEDVVENDDFYALDNLINNKYIKKIESKTQKSIIEIKEDGLYYGIGNTNKVVKATDFTETPKYVYAFSLDESGGATGAQKFVLTEEGNLFYLENQTSSNTEKVTLKKLNSKTVTNIYTEYVLGKDIVAECEDGTLIAFNKDVKEEKVETHFEFPNWQQAPNGYGYKALEINQNNVINNIKYNEQDIVVNDTFGVYDYNKSQRNVYIVDENSNILVIKNVSEENPATSEKVKLYKTTKVSNISYKGKDNYNTTIKITYEDGTNETFSEAVLSSLYIRNNK